MLLISLQKMVEALYDISIHLYNTNALEYALIAQSGPISMIHDIEGIYIL